MIASGWIDELQRAVEMPTGYSQGTACTKWGVETDERK